MASKEELEEVYQTLLLGKKMVIDYVEEQEVLSLLSQLHKYRTSFENNAISVGFYGPADRVSISAEWDKKAKRVTILTIPRGIKKVAKLNYKFVD